MRIWCHAPGQDLLSRSGAIVFILVALFAQMGCYGQDIIVGWNNVTSQSVRFGTIAPPPGARALAILHTSIHDALQGVARTGPSFWVSSNAPAGCSPEAAVAGAAHTVLTTLFPTFSTTFDAEFHAQVDLIPDAAARAAGVEWGRSVARTILRSRSTDGSQFGVDYDPRPGPGWWEPTPPLFASALLPNWARLQPFTMDAPTQFRPGPPPPLESAEWAAELAQVQSLGAAVGSSRTREQTEIAYFWADGAGTETPPGHWNRIAREYAEARNLDLYESARLFALLNLALADAAIVAWDAKYAYEFWRPITAIRAADTDGNPATVADPNWTPLLITPPFPEYVSGHSTFSAAAATVLARFHGSDDYVFSTTSDGAFGLTRTYHSFSEAAEEAGMSRIYGGIHFMSGNREGQSAGRKVGEWVMANFLVPPDRARVVIERVGEACRLTSPKGYTLQTAPGLAGPWETPPVASPYLVPVGGKEGFFRVVLDPRP